MTEFQVGDRVSVEGVVEKVGSGDYHIRLNSPAKGAKAWFYASAMTLVERPKRKLRVGSVWECDGRQRYVHIGKDMLTDWLCSDPPVHRSRTTIDETPDLWREVPVEELEREAS